MENEIKDLKKTWLIIKLIIIISDVAFISTMYKNSIASVIVFLTIVTIIILKTQKRQRIKIDDINFSIELIKNNKQQIIKELKKSDFDEKREYLITDNFYIDLNRKTAFKFSEVKKIKLIFQINYIPFIDNRGVNQLIELTFNNNKKVRILNWTSDRFFSEDGKIYNTIIEKTKNNKDISY